MRVSCLCVLLAVLYATAMAQTPRQFLVPESTKAATAMAASTADAAAGDKTTAYPPDAPRTDDSSPAAAPKAANPPFRVVRLPIGSGA